MFLLKIGVPQTCFEIALTWSSRKNRILDTQRIHQDKLIKQGIQFPHGKMVNLVKKETITLGPLVRCARHGITLPGHIGTNVITLESMFQPSYLTEIQIWLVSGYLRVRMPEKKKVRHKLTRRHRKILGKCTMEASSETRVHHLTKEGTMRWLMDLVTIPQDFQKDGFPQLCE